MKTNPKTMRSEKMIDEVGPFEINGSSFPFVIGLENKITWLADSAKKYIQVKIQQVE